MAGSQTQIRTWLLFAVLKQVVSNPEKIQAEPGETASQVLFRLVIVDKNLLLGLLSEVHIFRSKNLHKDVADLQTLSYTLQLTLTHTRINNVIADQLPNGDRLQPQPLVPINKVELRFC